MSKNKIIKQGEIYFVSLDGIDSEQQNSRPCLVISADVRNLNSDNVFIFPITHAKKKAQPCHYLLLKDDYPFFTYKENIVLCEEGRSVSKRRLQRKLGMISDKDISNILEVKNYVFIQK